MKPHLPAQPISTNGDAQTSHKPVERGIEPAASKVSESAQKVAAGLGRKASIPQFHLKSLFQPARFEAPRKPEALVQKVIDTAFRTLPGKLVNELSRLPDITADLALQHNTSVENLRMDYAQFAATHAAYHLSHALNQMLNKHWAPLARQIAQPAVNQLAESLIVQKLDACLTPEGLKSLVDSVDLTVSRRVDSTVGQKEYFQIHQLFQSLIAGAINTGHSCANVLDTLTSMPTGEEADEILSKMPQNEFRQRYLDLFAGLENGLTEFVKSYSTQVDGANKASPASLKGSLWMTDQQSAFNTHIENALQGLGAPVRDAFLMNFLFVHLQLGPHPASAYARNLPAFQVADHELETQRLKTVTKSLSRDCQTAEHVEWLIGAALQGFKSTLDVYGLEQLCQAYADNRSGYATKDSGVYRHMAEVAGKSMLRGVTPVHRKPVLNVLASFGEVATRYFRKGQLQIVTMPRESGLKEADGPQSKYATSAASSSSSDLQPEFTSRKRCSEIWFDQKSFRRLISNEPTSRMWPQYRASTNTVSLSQNYASDSECTISHELGHAIDSRVLSHYSSAAFESTVNKALSFEYQSIRDKKSGISTYAETHSSEYFAESVAAFLNQHGPNTSHADWAAYKDLYARDNLQAHHPVAEQFLDELIRNPAKPARARAVTAKTGK